MYSISLRKRSGWPSYMGLRWMDGATTSSCSAVQCFDGKDGSRIFPSWFAPLHVFGSCGMLSSESSRDSWYGIQIWDYYYYFDLLLLSFASFILCFGFLRKTSPLEVCERASHDFDHIIKKSACLNGFFLTTKYIGKSEESSSLFERAASSKIEQNSLLLVCSMFSETVFTNFQRAGRTWMDVFDFWAWLRYFKLCQHLKLDMKLVRCKRTLVFTGSVVFPGQVIWTLLRWTMKLTEIAAR